MTPPDEPPKTRAVQPPAFAHPAARAGCAGRSRCGAGRGRAAAGAEGASNAWRRTAEASSAPTAAGACSSAWPGWGWRWPWPGPCSAQRAHTPTSTKPHTALVEVQGEIAPGNEASAELLVGALKNAFEDEGAQAVVLRINSPGGSPVQSGIVNDEIRRLKALHKKKVYAVVEEMCASGAYYIAVAADEIYVDKASLVGSIGVLMDGFGFTGIDGQAGHRAPAAHRRREQGHARPVLAAERTPDGLRQGHDRPDPPAVHHRRQAGPRRAPEGDPETFSGLFWNGEEAIKLGLADKLGNLDYVAREVVKAEDIIDYTPRDNVAERLAKRFGAAIGQGAVKALRELPRIH
jgi:protease-4